MRTTLPTLDELPRQSASQVKNKWGDLVRQVHQSGSVAVTSHSAIDMVLLSAATYRQLVKEVAAFNQREQVALDELASRFEARLAVLQKPDAGNNVDAVFASGGKLVRRPKAGAAF